MKKKEDLRIVKTRASLSRSLMNLMKNKSFDEIKISELCSVSNINRSTFYDHFNDKNELLLAVLDELKIELDNILIVTKKTSNIKDYYIELVKIIIDYLHNNKEIYSTIFKIKGNSMARDMLEDILSSKVLDEINNNYHNASKIIDTNSFITFYSNAIISVIINSFNNNYNKDKTIKLIISLIPDITYIK